MLRLPVHLLLRFGFLRSILCFVPSTPPLFSNFSYHFCYFYGEQMCHMARIIFPTFPVFSSPPLLTLMADNPSYLLCSLGLTGRWWNIYTKHENVEKKILKGRQLAPLDKRGG